MKINYLLTVFLSALSLAGAAQDAPLPQNLSLEEAVGIAVRNNAELNVRTYEYEIAGEKIAEARFRRLPAVSGGFDFTRNLIIPTTPVPANAFNPNAPADEITALRFGTNWTANAGLNVRYPLLDKSIEGSIREREEERALAAIDREIGEAELTAQVRLAYAECLLARAQVDLALGDTLNSRTNLEVIGDRYRNGRARVNEWNQARIERNNAQNRLAESYHILERAENKLRYYLGYPEEDRKIGFEEDLEGLFEKLKPAAAPELNFGESLTGRQLNQQLSLAELRMTNVHLDDLPTLAVSGFLGANFFDNNLGLFNANNWFGGSYLALNLQVPITSRLENKRRVSQRQYQVLSARESLRAQRQEKTYEFRQALDDLRFHESNLAIRRQNIGLSEENYQIVLQQYREGRATADELSRADFQLKQAKFDYLRTFYNCIQSAIQLQDIQRRADD
jgi:outer membrane protein TolC